MLPKQKGIEISSGKLLSENSDNFFLNAGLVVHSKKGNYMLYVLEYSKETVPYRTNDIAIETYFAEAGYIFNMIANNKKSLMFNVTLSAVAGYESLNRGERLLNDGSLLINESSFVYGAEGRLSVEYYLSDRFSVIASSRTKLLWNTSRDPLRASTGIGLRVNL
ncbi:conjugal transfer protein TraO [Chryseobacterium sp. CY350]|nr:conjugal transfer protein TraO [Chryseobacterium sp. CY350]